MTWTDQHQAEAAVEGWGIYSVFDLTTRRLSYKILTAGHQFRNSENATRHVVHRARQRSPLHVAALKKIYVPK